jgi:bacterioferritin
MKNTNGLKNRKDIMERLNDLLEFELSGITRYLHYSFMIFGPNRIPITKWLRDQAQDGFEHATLLGEWITALDGHPTVRVRPTPDAKKHDTRSMLLEALEFEQEGVRKYKDLLELVRDNDVALEEFVRGMIEQEQDHLYEMDKMLRA